MGIDVHRNYLEILLKIQILIKELSNGGGDCMFSELPGAVTLQVQQGHIRFTPNLEPSPIGALLPLPSRVGLDTPNTMRAESPQVHPKILEPSRCRGQDSVPLPLETGKLSRLYKAQPGSLTFVSSLNGKRTMDHQLWTCLEILEMAQVYPTLGDVFAS